jgi:tRNA (guanine37-N1)-methyltransferase
MGMTVDIVTPFPDMFTGFLGESMVARAQKKNLAVIRIHDLRGFAEDKHKTVDDYPYGGGAGMILKPEPIFKAVDAIREMDPSSKPRIILPTPQGSLFDQAKAGALAQCSHLVFLCGHYRGVDERVVQGLAPDEISIGDYVLSGGELAAAVIIDAVVRLIPGVLGNSDSADGDSISSGRLDHPHYTRPEESRGMKVPDVLLSGHHEAIRRWRETQSMEKTKARRPDLLDPNQDKGN